MIRNSIKILLVAAASVALWGCQTPPQGANQAGNMAPLPEAKARYVVFFTPWSSRLEAGGKTVVTVAAHKIIRDGHVRVTVIGYTDPRGTIDQDKKLSADRANAVANALVDNGVDRSLIEVKFVGSAGYVSDSVEGRRAVIAVNNM